MKLYLNEINAVYKVFSVLKGQKKNGEEFNKLLATSVTGEKSQKELRTTHIYVTGHHSQSALDVRTIYQNSTESWAWCSLPLTTKPNLCQHFDSRTSRNAWVMLRVGTCEFRLVGVGPPKTCSRIHHPWNTQFLILLNLVSPQVISQVTVTCLT